MTQGPDAWDGLLDPDEEIVWQGRPDGRFHVAPKQLFPAVFGVIFAGFAVFWMNLASQAGGNFWMFGILHFAVGLGMAAAALFGNTYLRQHTWYTLTTKRAFIATNLPLKGKSLKSYPITRDIPLEFIDDDPGTIWFAESRRRTKSGSSHRKHGFERIPEARAVYAQIRAIRRGDHAGDQHAV